MKATRMFAPCLVAALVFPAKVHALSVIVQYQGAVDDREAYFADVRSSANETPAYMVGTGIEVRTIPVTAVYENAKKPEFVHMELWFQCPDRFILDKDKREISENKDTVRASDAVTFRIGPGSFLLRRTDLETEAVPESDWKTSSAPMLSKAGTLACNHIEIDQALHAAIKDDGFDFDGFGKRIAKLGLPADMAVIGETLPSAYLGFAWETLWWDKVADGKRPDPTGRWSTPVTEADKRVAMERLKAQQQGLEAGTAGIRASLLDSIKKRRADTTADLQADQNAGKHPDGSKMNKREKKLMAVFGGRPEQEVVATMGNPDDFNQVGDTRFLRYSAWWEQQGVIVYGAQGVIGGDAGGYAECTAEFSIRPDREGEWRVDDIVVRGDYEGTGSREIRLVCNDAIRPRR